MTSRQMKPPRGLVLPLATVCVAAGLAFAASGVRAQTDAYTSEPVDLFAGPSDAYPVVSELGPNVPVTVMGCVSDYSWCDVALPGLRGWIYAGYLSYPYQGAYVPLAGYGAAIGLPIVAFSVGAYWGSFYRDRPWYGDRERWAHVPPPGRGRPPEPHYQGGPGRPLPPPGAGRPPEPGRPPGNEAPRPPGEMQRPPMEGARPPAEMQRPPAEMQRPPAEMQRPPAEGARPPMPQPNAGRPPAQAPAPGFNRPPGPPPGGARPPEAPAAHGRPEGAPQGGHPSGQGGGHGEQRQQN
ncbi:SH3 domain-containing protein [Paraburkholderia sp. J63]|uniref:SH3 domain-containing protein n=1 Tax=Paraburkholderia sp. J63 TaxID=2805434 RepID=UPI002ABE3BBA|nr:SH3 domain-containing protein [Paraburkholderia sp. J63]